MTVRLFSYFLFLLFTFVKIAVFAQTDESWTLKRCIDHAHENNLTIKQQKLNVNLSEYILLQSKADLLPNLNANISQNYNFGRAVDPFTNQFTTERVRSNSLSLSANVTLFNGFQQINTISQNKYNLIAGRYDVDNTKNNISLSIAQAYLQILLNEELLNIAENQFAVIKQQREKIIRLVNAGSMAKGNLLDIEAQIAAEEMNVVNSQNFLDLSYLDLAQLLDIDTLSGFKISKPEIDIPENSVVEGTPEQIFGAALTTQPQIMSAEYKLKGYEKGLSVAKGSKSPRLSIGGTYGTGYSTGRQKFVENQIISDNPVIGYDFDSLPVYSYTPYTFPLYEITSFEDQARDNLSQTIGLNFSVPIFNNLQSKISVERAKIAVLNSEYGLELEKNQLRKNIRQAFADAAAALKKYRASEKTVTALKESFSYAEQRFNAGMVTSVDYNDSKNKFIKAQSEMLQAKYEFVFKTKILDFYQGKPLVLGN